MKQQSELESNQSADCAALPPVQLNTKTQHDGQEGFTIHTEPSSYLLTGFALITAVQPSPLVSASKVTNSPKISVMNKHNRRR
ncbi:hypothetical protein Q5P01_013300 [Channa striata]|uniref:Uncharacterized protein n=1 Tax=Channa striata TaxID=64152 RepID=A0AA88MM21_CHASR|nr:hypothetical protein Q5P01_013300 [Channa striata]